MSGRPYSYAYPVKDKELLSADIHAKFPEPDSKFRVEVGDHTIIIVTAGISDKSALDEIVEKYRPKPKRKNRPVTDGN